MTSSDVQIRRDGPVAIITLNRPAVLNALHRAMFRALAHGLDELARDATVRVLLLTGARKMEILGLQWAWVDFERSMLRLPDSKTGAKVIPLGAPALGILAGLPRIDGNPFVLAGGKKGAHLVGLQKIFERVKRRAGLHDLRIHDLRHAFASAAVMAGDSIYVVGKLLGHSNAATTQRYAHLADDPLRAAADRNARRLEAAMAGKSAEVVPIKREGPR